MMPRVKICGLTRRGDAEAAVAAGADYLGAVFAPSPRRVEAAVAAAVFSGLDAIAVGVFVDASTRTMIATATQAGLGVLQLHGDESPARFAELRGSGAWEIWKAIRVRDEADFERAVEWYAPVADALLLDAWSAGARGGTGASFAWDRIAPLRDIVPPGLRLIVAGGVRADNALRAVELLRPDVLDVGSGVETEPGVKSRAAIVELMNTLSICTP
jgi:phosphoribosylanthranilate isomerase